MSLYAFPPKGTLGYEADQLHGYRLDVDPMCNTFTITRIRCLHAHPGKNKTFDFLREEYYGITKKLYSFYSFNILMSLGSILIKIAPCTGPRDSRY